MARRGFTLIEVMVALVIFSLLSAGAFGVLSGLLRARQTLDAQDAHLQALQELALLSQYDISQTVPRAPNASPSYVQAAGDSLVFVRGGWRNPMEEGRSSLALVRYHLENGALLRQLWPMGNGQNPAVTSHLGNGASFASFAAIAAAPRVDPPPVMLPGAIDWHVTLPPLGDIEQIIPLVEAP